MEKIIISTSETLDGITTKLSQAFLRTHLFSRFLHGTISGSEFIITDKFKNMMQMLPILSTTIYSHTIFGKIIPSNNSFEIQLEIKSNFLSRLFICLIFAIIILLLQPNLKTALFVSVPMLIAPFVIKYYMEARIRRFLDYALN